MSQYQPFAIARKVRRQEITAAGAVIFTTKSFSNDTDKYSPVVNLDSGQVWCDCPDFHYRHAKHEPTINTPQNWCKHVTRAVNNCRRRGEVVSAAVAAKANAAGTNYGIAMECECQRHCSLCGAPDARFEMCDDGGEAIPNRFICEDCIFDRGDDLGDAAPELPEASAATVPPAATATPVAVTKEQRIRAIIVRPFCRPEVALIYNDLKTLQALVEGSIEVFALDHGGALEVVSNENFIAEGLPPSCHFPEHDIFICGTCFVTASVLTPRGREFRSLTKDEIAHILNGQTVKPLIRF